MNFTGFGGALPVGGFPKKYSGCFTKHSAILVWKPVSPTSPPLVKRHLIREIKALSFSTHVLISSFGHSKFGPMTIAMLLVFIFVSL